MADLAAHAGVSTATVSRVLAGKAGVSAATRQAVLDSMEALGYSRDRVGPSNNFVAIMVPELSNPSFAAFAEQLDTHLFAAGYASMLFAAGASGSSEQQHLGTISSLNPAGVVSVSGTPADTLSSSDPYAHLARAGVPTVFINGYAPEVPGAFFSTNDSEAVSMSVAHLRLLGHERIGLAVGQSRYIPSLRKTEAFRELGFGPQSIVSTIFTVEGGQLAAARLLDAGHTALVCGSDIMALGAIREIRSRGLSCPGDISVVGYDDTPLMAFTDPALTTVRQPVRTLCKAAVAALMGALEGVPLEPTEMLFHPDLIIRNSTGPTS